MEWNDIFLKLFSDAVERYHSNPNISPERIFLSEEVQFIESIGYRPLELYQYIEDFATLGTPSPSTALLIAATRRNHFYTVQRSISGNSKTINANQLPPDSESFNDIPYLPRIIKKAEAKLFGTLDPNLMYYCGKDRDFLKKHGDIDPCDFLQIITSARGDRQKILTAVFHRMRQQEQATAASNEA